MTTKTALDLLATVVALFGILVSIWGTFLLTRFYHPFEPLSFLRSVMKAIGLFLTGRQNTAKARARIATSLGSITPEKKAESLLGIYWIFIGFVLQGVGLLLTLASNLVELLAPHMEHISK